MDGFGAKPRRGLELGRGRIRLQMEVYQGKGYTAQRAMHSMSLEGSF